jgi:uncharacterized OB-fold protein
VILPELGRHQSDDAGAENSSSIVVNLPDFTPVKEELETGTRLPEVTPENEHFWRGGAAGELRLLRCPQCAYWVHPPLPRCPECLASVDLAVEAVSGRAVVHSVTGTIAVVRLAEQDDLLLVTTVPEGTAIDDKVTVRFEHHDDVWLPVFA